MWPFKKKIEEPTRHQIAQKALGIAGIIPPSGEMTFGDTTPTRFNPTGLTAISDFTDKLGRLDEAEKCSGVIYTTDDPEAIINGGVSAAASEADEHRSTVSTNDRETVAFHVNQIKGLVESIETRRSSVLESMRLDREDFEAREAANNAKVDEFNRLLAVYAGALKIASDGSLKWQGSNSGNTRADVDAAKLTEVGKKIARTRRNASKAEPRMTGNETGIHQTEENRP